MAEKLLRFKDVLEMQGQDSFSRPLSFNDLHTTQYRPGEDELTNYRAYRRRRVGDVGSDTATYSESTQHEGFFDSIGDTRDRVRKAKAAIGRGMDKITAMQKYRVTPKDLAEDTEVDEALTVQQRLARKRMFKRIQPKIKRGREIAKRRIASKEKLQKRSMKKARMAMFKKLTKDVPKGELTYARRQEIEKRLDKPAIKKRIAMIARKMFPKERQAELAKKRGGKR